MKKYIKQYIKQHIKTMLILVMSVTVATSSIYQADTCYAGKFDGDIADNLVTDLSGDKAPGDLIIGGNDKQEETKEKTKEKSKEKTEETNLSNKQKEELSNLKKKLTTKILSASKANKNSRKAIILLKKNKKATGYQIQYSATKGFKKSQTKTKSFKKQKITVKKLKRAKKYYVRARVYSRIYGIKVYGKWSGKRSIRILK